MREDRRRNMMKRNTCAVIITSALIGVLVGLARAGDEFNRPGPYVGLGAAGGLSQFGGTLQNFGDSAGFNARGGYRFNDYLAIEGLYEYMDEFGSSQKFSSGTKVTTHFQTNNFSLMSKVILPTLGITRLQLYVSGGIGFLN